MRRGRILIFLLLIVIVGLVVVFFAFRALLTARPAQPQGPQNVDIIVAGQPIPQGATITDDQLTTFSIPQDKVSAAEFTNDRRSQVVGKVAKYPIDQGVPITSSLIVESTAAVPIAGPQWAALIPPGMRAISIPATRLALVAYGIDAGAHVDLNACYMFVDIDPAFQSELPSNTAKLTATGFPQNELPILSLGVGATGGPLGRLELDQSLQQPFYLVPSEKQRPRLVCQTILQNAVVMKRGNFPLSSTTPQAAQQQSQQQAQQAAAAPDTVTLIVSPQDADALMYMEYSEAQIQLTLRNPNDPSRLATEAATLQFMLSQYNIPVPAKLPYSLEPRIDSLTAPLGGP